MGTMDPVSSDLVAPELVAVVVGVLDTTPRVLTIGGGTRRLPSGPLRSEHRSMQEGVRAWVESQADLRLGYVEQLYTFADRDRLADNRNQGDAAMEHVISVSYLALTRLDDAALLDDAREWASWYELFPWEDARGEPSPSRLRLAELVNEWAKAEPETRWSRAQVAFGLDGAPWSPELTLQRYEVLYEAGLVPESGEYVGAARALDSTITGPRMAHDHRRILATGIARLRSKIQYQPVVFELMPDEFTLGQLQLCVESLAGQEVHKQNFRRLVAHQELVEETGGRTSATGGRPAALFRFRGDVIDRRAAVGTKLPRLR